MKLVNGFYFPDGDIVQNSVVFSEICKIKAISNYCRKKDVAVQAGGNVGVFPVFMSSIFKSVYTFEPMLENFSCLKQNTKNYNK